MDESPQISVYSSRHGSGHAALRNALKKINGGFSRSTTAIHLTARRLMICKSDEGYTMLGVCALFGIDHHKVEKWVSKGYLKGKPRGTVPPLRTERSGLGKWIAQERSASTSF
ncbi:MAG: hypothetical protein ABSC57_00455 [Syntrophales bacterium]